MGVRRLALGAAQVDHPRLDHDAAGAQALASLGIVAPAVLAQERRHQLGAPTARIEAAGPCRAVAPAIAPPARRRKPR